MDSSLATPPVGVAAEDLPDVAELSRMPGPFVSVVMNTHRELPDAARQVQAAWERVAQGLARDGAPTALLERVREQIGTARTDGSAVAVIAAGDSLAVRTHDEPTEELAVWDTAPVLAPFVDWEQSTPPGVLAVVDRTGADLFATGCVDPVEVVEGQGGPIVHRGAPGGWSQRRFQQRAERTWRANAGSVAEQLQRVVEDIDARVVVIAGDVRAVREVLDQLPPEIRAIVHQAAGSRGEGSTGHLDDDTRRWYRSVVAEDSVALIRKFEEELGQRDRGVSGVGPTLEALRMSAVDTLLVHDAELRAQRVPVDAGDAAAPDALIAAAWATGARVRVVPGLPGMDDGVGALLRFPVGAESDPA